MSEFKKIKLAEIRAIIENRLEEKARNPYAIGMAAAKKAAHDEPPLKKSTIVKGHEIAKKIMNKEEVQQIDEIGNTPAGKKALVSYIGKRAKSLNYDSDTAYGLGQDDPDAWDKLDSGTKGIERAAKRLAKEESGETYDTTTHAPTAVKPIKKFKGKAPVDPVSTHEEADMLDTSLSDIDASKTGEVYKKVKEKSTAPAAPTGTATHVVAGKDGEAYNTTGITKRVPAVESAVLEVMAQTMQKRKMFEDAANIAIISQDQRQDWLDVSTGKMDVVDYFNKYKV